MRLFPYPGMMFGCIFGVAAFLCSAAVQAEVLFNKQAIFPLQEMHVHSSSIVELPNGDLLTVWFHGSGERTADDVVLLGSRMKAGSDTWSPVFPMAETPNTPDCNPVLFLDNNERLWLFWIAVNANRWEQSILKYRYTDNWGGDGAPEWEWQDVLLLKPGEEFAEALSDGLDALDYYEPLWAEYAWPYTRLLKQAAQDQVKRDIGWMTRTALVTLDSGRILLPLYSDGFNVSLIAYSDDEGATWQTSDPIVGLGNIQPSLAVRKNGQIVAYMRDNGPLPKRIQVATSEDDGETWSTAEAMDLPNPGASVAVDMLQDGRWVLVYNDAERGRHNMTISLSDDEGATWSMSRILEADDEAMRYGYPFVIQDEDGILHVTYSSSGPDGATIIHLALHPDWIAGNS